MEATGRTSPYWPTGRLYRYRELVGRSRDPRLWASLAWAEYLDGHPGRAREALERVRRLSRGGRRELGTRLWTMLLDRMIRGRRVTPGELRKLLQQDPEALSTDAGLAAMGQYVVLLGRSGCSPALRAGLFERLADRASGRAPRLEQEFRLRQARCLLAAGRLQEARALARELRLRRPPGAGAPGVAAVVERVVAALLDERRGLEGLHFADMNLYEQIQSRLLVAGAELRLGRPERAREQLEWVHRRNQALRDGGVTVMVGLLRARGQLLDGKLEEMEETLAGLPGPPDLSRDLGWERDLLAARSARARGEDARARRLLARVLPHLEEQEEAWTLRDARLLELELDLARRPDAAGPARTESLWEEALGWEEPTDRLRLAVLVMQGPAASDLGARVQGALTREAHGAGRTATLSRILEAAERRATGDEAGVRAALRRIENPPASDLPERTLARWLQLLQARVADASALLARGRPGEVRAELALVRRLHPPGPERYRLVTPSREARLDRWDLLRLRDAPRRVPLWVDAVEGEAYGHGRALGLARHPRLMDLLRLLLENPGRTFSMEELLERIWQRELVPYESDRLVYTGISRLRRALPERGWVRTVDGAYGVAPELDYQLLVPDRPADSGSASAGARSKT